LVGKTRGREPFIADPTPLNDPPRSRLNERGFVIIRFIPDAPIEAADPAPPAPKFIGPIAIANVAVIANVSAAADPANAFPIID
jgi:hypothetical protein